MDVVLGVVCHKNFFPTMLVVLDVAAAIASGCHGDKGRVMYWLCAAGITFAATWMMK